MFFSGFSRLFPLAPKSRKKPKRGQPPALQNDGAAGILYHCILPCHKIANVQPLPATCPQISTDLLRLTEQYRRDEENISRQIEKLRARIKQRPEPHELEQLEFRIDVLLCERRELRAAADHMLRLAAPPPLSPSLLARERGAS